MLHVSSVKDKISRFFSAHPVLKHLISSLLILITLTFIFYLVYHISEDGFELQELMKLRNAVVTITVLAMAIFWVSRPVIYRIITIVGIICTLLSGTLAPDFVRHRPQGSLTACKSNLKNIGTAMEMYSTDNKGLYPNNLAAVTPNYLITLPTCAEGGRMSYRYASTDRHDIFTVWCEGVYHADKSPINMPQYDSVDGLHER